MAARNIKSTARNNRAPVTVTEAPHALKIEVHPCREIPRTLVLNVQLRPYGATMLAELYVDESYVMGTGGHRIPPRQHEPHWRLRLGICSALLLGDVALQLTEAQAHVFEAALVPHGIEVLGPKQAQARAGALKRGPIMPLTRRQILARVSKYRRMRDTALAAASDAKRCGHRAGPWVAVARHASRELVGWLQEVRT